MGKGKAVLDSRRGSDVAPEGLPTSQFKTGFGSACLYPILHLGGGRGIRSWGEEGREVGKSI